MTDVDMRFGAIELAGGSARRMGGVDQSALTVGSTTLLDCVLLAVTHAGQDQLLVGVWRTVALRSVVPAGAGGGSLRGALSGLDVVRVALPADGPRPAPWTDCDAPGELRLARQGA